MTATSFVQKLWLASLAILIFLIPSNLFVVLTEKTGYVTGLRIDYLLPKLYASDLAAWIFISLGCYVWHTDHLFSAVLTKWKNSLRNSWSAKTLFVTSFMLIMYQFLSPLPIVGSWFVFHLITAVLVGWVLVANKTHLNGLMVVLALFTTVVFQTLLASYQFWTQKSLVGYQLLGEVTLSKPFGIAHASFGGFDQALAYGTTAHPNVLAGTVVLFTLLIIRWRQVLPKVHHLIWPIFSLICAFIVLYITQSVSAVLALGIGLISVFIYGKRQTREQSWMLTKFKQLFFVQKMSIPHWFWVIILIMLISPIVLLLLIQVYPENLSLQRRVWLNSAAIQIAADHLALGTGLNQFTAIINDSHTNNELVRFNQPAHHLGLLWVAETGILGLIWLGSLIITWKSQLPWTKLALGLFILLPIAVLDHYLLSLQTGRLLTAVFLILITIEKVDPTSSVSWRSLLNWSR